MSFNDIPGQERAFGRLSGWLKAGVTPQALLLVGPEGTGKSKTALAYARALNCERTVDPRERLEPCAPREEACPSCRFVAASTHPEILVVSPEESRLKIDQVREAIETIRLHRLIARRRVLVFLNADTLMLQAANALLKTLEEPPPETTIILVAESTRGLPLTVLSRCWQIRFSPLHDEALKSAVDLSGLSPDQAERAMTYSHGIPGKAARYADWFKSGDAMKYLNDLWTAVKSGGGAAIAFAEKHSRDKDEFPSRLELLADAWNAALVKSLTSSEKSSYRPGVWLELTEMVLRARKLLDVNANRKLLLESLIYKARKTVQKGDSATQL